MEHYQYDVEYVQFQKSHILSLPRKTLETHAKKCSSYNQQKKAAILRVVNGVAKVAREVENSTSVKARLDAVQRSLAIIENGLGYPHFTTRNYYKDLLSKDDPTNDTTTQDVPAVLHVLQCPLYTTYGLNDNSKIGQAFLKILKAVTSQLLQDGIDRPTLLALYTEVCWICARFVAAGKGCAGELPTEDDGAMDEDLKNEILSLAVLITFVLLKIARIRVLTFVMHGTPAAKSVGLNAASAGENFDPHRPLEFFTELQGLDDNALHMVQVIFGMGANFIVIPHFSSILRVIGEESQPYLGDYGKVELAEKADAKEKKKTFKFPPKPKDPSKLSGHMVARCYLTFGIEFATIIINSHFPTAEYAVKLKKATYVALRANKMFLFAPVQCYDEVGENLLTWPAMWNALYGNKFELKKSICSKVVRPKKEIKGLLESDVLLYVNKILPGVQVTKEPVKTKLRSATSSVDTPRMSFQVPDLCHQIQAVDSSFKSIKASAELINWYGQPKLFRKLHRDCKSAWASSAIAAVKNQLLGLTQESFKSLLKEKRLDPAKVVWLPAFCVTRGKLKKDKADILWKAERANATDDNVNLGQILEMAALILVEKDHLIGYEASIERDEKGVPQPGKRRRIPASHVVMPAVHYILPLFQRLNAVNSRCPLEIIGLHAILDEQTVLINAVSEFGSLHGYFLNKDFVEKLEAVAPSLPTLVKKKLRYPPETDFNKQKQLHKKVGDGGVLFDHCSKSLFPVAGELLLTKARKRQEAEELSLIMEVLLKRSKESFAEISLSKNDLLRATLAHSFDNQTAMRTVSKPWDVSVIIKRHGGRLERLFELFACRRISLSEKESSGCLFLSVDVTSLVDHNRNVLELSRDTLSITYTRYHVLEEGDVIVTPMELSLDVSLSEEEKVERHQPLKSLNESFRQELVQGGHRHPIRLLKVEYSVEHGSVSIVPGSYTPFNTFSEDKPTKHDRSRMLPAQCVRANRLETAVRPGCYGPIDTANRFDALSVFGGDMDTDQSIAKMMTGQSILDAAVLGLQFANEAVRAVGEDEKMCPWAPVVRGSIDSESDSFRSISGRVRVGQVAMKVTEEVLAVFLMLEKVVTQAYQQHFVDKTVEKAVFSHLMDAKVGYERRSQGVVTSDMFESIHMSTATVYRYLSGLGRIDDFRDFPSDVVVDSQFLCSVSAYFARLYRLGLSDITDEEGVTVLLEELLVSLGSSDAPPYTKVPLKDIKPVPAEDSATDEKPTPKKKLKVAEKRQRAVYYVLFLSLVLSLSSLSSDSATSLIKSFSVEELETQANGTLRKLIMAKEIPYVVFTKEVNDKNVWRVIVPNIDFNAFSLIDSEYQWWDVPGVVDTLWRSVLQISKNLFPTLSLPTPTLLPGTHSSSASGSAVASPSSQSLLPSHFVLYSAFEKAKSTLGIKGKTTKAETLRLIFEKLVQCSSLADFEPNVISAFVTKMRAQAGKKRKRKKQKERKNEDEQDTKSIADDAEVEDNSDDDDDDEELASGNSDKFDMWVSCDEVSNLSYEADLLEPLIRHAAGVTQDAPGTVEIVANPVPNSFANAANPLNATTCQVKFAVSKQTEIYLEIADSHEAITALRALLKRHRILAAPKLNNSAWESVGCLFWSFAGLANNSVQPIDDLLAAFQTTSTKVAPVVELRGFKTVKSNKGRPKKTKNLGKPDFNSGNIQGLANGVVSPEHCQLLNILIHGKANALQTSESISALRQAWIKKIEGEIQSYLSNNKLRHRSEMFRKRFLDEETGNLMFPSNVASVRDGWLCSLSTQSFSPILFDKSRGDFVPIRKVKPETGNLEPVQLAGYLVGCNDVAPPPLQPPLPLTPMSQSIPQPQLPQTLPLQPPPSQPLLQPQLPQTLPLQPPPSQPLLGQRRNRKKHGTRKKKHHYKKQTDPPPPRNYSTRQYVVFKGVRIMLGDTPVDLNFDELQFVVWPNHPNRLDTRNFESYDLQIGGISVARDGGDIVFTFPLKRVYRQMDEEVEVNVDIGMDETDPAMVQEGELLAAVDAEDGNVLRIQWEHLHGSKDTVVGNVVGGNPYLLSKKTKTIALDPGLVPFLSGCDLEGNAVKFGMNNPNLLRKDNEGIAKRQSEADQLVNLDENVKDLREKLVRLEKERLTFQLGVLAGKSSLKTIDEFNLKVNQCQKDIGVAVQQVKTVNPRCSQLQKEIEDIRARIAKRTERIHQSALEFLDAYECVIIPRLNVKQCIRKSGNLPGSVKTDLQQVSSLKFVGDLVARKAKKGGSVVFVDESYTTKLMTCCGRFYLNNGVGAGKRNKCRYCGCSVDRDVNGARNILLFALVRSLLHFMERLTERSKQMDSPMAVIEARGDDPGGGGGGLAGGGGGVGATRGKDIESLTPVILIIQRMLLISRTKESRGEKSQALHRSLQGGVH
ncbi:hypothetical protein HDV05_004697 [Chytridiales sp. JEL 0842]|nr:hypothetical protein HDV05_004697 [Chytridiales sp. JEL 0842]